MALKPTATNKSLQVEANKYVPPTLSEKQVKSASSAKVGPSPNAQFLNYYFFF